MNEPTPDPLDELASSRLDGDPGAAGAPEGIDELELAERTAAFEAVRRALQEGIEPPPDAAREANIAAALAERDALRRGADIHTAPANVRPFRRRGWPRWAAAAAAAAAVALLAFALPSMLEDGPREADQTAAAPESVEQDDAATTLGGGRGEAAADGSDETSTAERDVALSAEAPPMTQDLGTHEDLAGLRAAALALIAADTDSQDPARDPEPPDDDPEALDDTASACLAQLADTAAADGQRVVMRARAMLADLPVVLVVVADPSGERSLVVADPAEDCSTVVSEPL